MDFILLSPLSIVFFTDCRFFSNYISGFQIIVFRKCRPLMLDEDRLHQLYRGKNILQIAIMIISGRCLLVVVMAIILNLEGVFLQKIVIKML